MTIKELSILKQNGEEVTLNFSDNGVLKNKVISNSSDENLMEVHYLRKDPNRYINIIDETLKGENIHNAIAISGVFKEDDGSLVEQEGLLGNIFYSNPITETEAQGE